jgi:peptidoglycan/xylan/chitin deacetylase (PgdA/CDA1 family)
MMNLFIYKTPTIIIMLFLLFTDCTTIINKEYPALPDKSILLTFDDGPNDFDSTTMKLLQVLQKHQVKACFCLPGINCTINKPIVRAIYKEGHTIVNHGLDDQMILFKTKHSLQKDIDNWELKIKMILDDSSFSSMYFRPPYGIYRLDQKSVFAKNRYKILTCSDYMYDAEVKPKDKFKILMKFIDFAHKKGKAVFVLHDGKDRNYTMKEKLSENPESPYNRTWIPEITDSIITILKREHFSFIQAESVIFD